MNIEEELRSFVVGLCWLGLTAILGGVFVLGLEHFPEATIVFSLVAMTYLFGKMFYS